MSLALTLFVAVLVLLAVLAMLAAGHPLLAWLVFGGMGLLGWFLSGVTQYSLFATLASLWVLAALFLGPTFLRARLVSPLLLRLAARILPRMSETERVALEAGTVWWDGALFSGAPDWRNLFGFRSRALTAAEQAFLDGPCEELCRLADDWAIVQAGDLSPQTWDFLKAQGFLGLIIPEEYGGKGFSAHLHSAVVVKLASRSTTAAVSVMVPNSLGPAELLLHYGTEEQKRHWLPRLARGDELPCFALTGPENGSDAAAMEATGVVERRSVDGREILGLRLNWNKRYTTLGPRATVIGMAFKLLDPERLLGHDPAPGITVALVAADLPGVTIGARHDPLGVPFLNGPNEGRDVFVPVDAIIGGPARAGHGWRMLMDCLAAGRAISLPSLATGCSQLVLRVVGNYASIRRQFGLPIGRFEGVAERLARIAGLTWMMDASRRLTAGAVDAGEKPSVLSAICKAWLTEAMRTVVNDGMDVVGGAGISRGPRNVLARAYQAVPIGITVEGANILTRSLIVFGQGAIRCHPWVTAEMAAVAARDVPAFDRAVFGHVVHVSRNSARALLVSLFGAPLPDVPLPRRERRLLARLDRFSTRFACLADAAMASLGGTLKRREMLSGRLADGLAWLYLGSASLHRWHEDGQPADSRPAMRWAVEHALLQGERALLGVLDNLPNRLVAWKLRAICFPLGARERGPSDKLALELAAAVIEHGALRERLTRDIHVPGPEDPGLGSLEAALADVLAAAPAELRLREAIRAGKLAPEPTHDLPARAAAARVLDEAERTAVERAIGARAAAIAVDAFDAEEFARLRG